MFALLEKSVAARSAIVVLSCLAVVGLAQAAVAGDDLGIRRLQFWPDQLFAPSPAEAPVAAASPVEAVARHRPPRRIWAAARSRPLRIALDRRHRRQHLAGRRRVQRLARAGGTGAAARGVAARFLTLPKPDRPALVSIYQDRTLRDGDAVMMADGIRLFHGGATWPHVGRDFVRLKLVSSLDWSLRHTLSDIDSVRPTPWSTVSTAAPTAG